MTTCGKGVGGGGSGSGRPGPGCCSAVCANKHAPLEARRRDCRTVVRLAALVHGVAATSISHHMHLCIYCCRAAIGAIACCADYPVGMHCLVVLTFFTWHPKQSHDIHMAPYKFSHTFRATKNNIKHMHMHVGCSARASSVRVVNRNEMHLPAC